MLKGPGCSLRKAPVLTSPDVAFNMIDQKLEIQIAGIPFGTCKDNSP